MATNSSVTQHQGDRNSTAKVSLSQSSEKFQAQQSADALARRSLNALAVTSSMVSSLIEFPGSKGDHEALVKAARTMLKCADETTKQLVSELGAEHIGWAPYRVMRAVSTAVADQWRSSSRTGQPDADLSFLLPVWKEICGHKVPELEFEDPARESSVALRIALLDAMLPVMREISIFDMLHKQELAAAHVRDKIIYTCQRALVSLNIDGVSERSKSMLMQSLLRNAGSIYASTWRNVAEETIDRLRALNKAEQTSLIERHPDGLPLLAIDQSFEGSFTKLVQMLQYLSVSREHAMTHDSQEEQTSSDRAADTSEGNAHLQETNAHFSDPETMQSSSGSASNT